MTQDDLLFKMWNEKDKFNPPLQIKEILDFYDTEIIDEPRLWFPELKKDLQRPLKLDVDKSKIVKYTTKIAITQDIKLLNDRLNWWNDRKHEARDEDKEIYVGFCEAKLEDLQSKKDDLQKKLRLTGIKSNNDDLERAKQAPISDFLKFNSAGFANCPFHGPERTNSFHKLPGKERGYCFGCQKRADLIDVIMEIHQCKLPEALKIILKK